MSYCPECSDQNLNAVTDVTFIKAPSDDRPLIRFIGPNNRFVHLHAVVITRPEMMTVRAAIGRWRWMRSIAWSRPGRYLRAKARFWWGRA